MCLTCVELRPRDQQVILPVIPVLETDFTKHWSLFASRTTQETNRTNGGNPTTANASTGDFCVPFSQHTVFK